MSLLWFIVGALVAHLLVGEAESPLTEGQLLQVLGIAVVVVGCTLLLADHVALSVVCVVVAGLLSVLSYTADFPSSVARMAPPAVSMSRGIGPFPFEPIE